MVKISLQPLVNLVVQRKLRAAMNNMMFIGIDPLNSHVTLGEVYERRSVRRNTLGTVVLPYRG